MIDLLYLKRRAAVNSRMRKAPHLTMENPSTNNEAWRKYGQARRKEVVEQDVAGGNLVEINPDCRVDRYFMLAERAVRQFKEMYELLDTSTLEQTYIMGHRLVALLSEGLPSHPEYMDPSKDQSRSATIRDLVWVHQRLDEIAMIIDEEQLNRYITDEFVPEHDEDDDDSTTCSSSTSGEGLYHLQDRSKTSVSSDKPISSDTWERFEGWSFDNSSDEEMPTLVESENSIDSFKDVDSQEEYNFESAVFSSHSIVSQTSIVEEVDEVECADPCIELSLSDDDVDDENSINYSHPIDLYEIQNAVRSSTFLRQISQQAVLFEFDSEACDSWDQGEEEAPSETQSHRSGELVCDPAVFLLQTMNKNARRTTSTRFVQDAPGLSLSFTESLSFDDEMPEDEAMWTVQPGFRSRSFSTSYFTQFDEEAPDDEAGD